MLQNIWPIYRYSGLTLKRARLLFAIINGVHFCTYKHIIMTMMETLNDNQPALPFGGLITRIYKQCVTDIPEYEHVDTPEGAFGKGTVMKFDAQLQRHWDPPPPVRPEPSAASSS
jgi:hypothetical protein